MLAASFSAFGPKPDMGPVLRDSGLVARRPSTSFAKPSVRSRTLRSAACPSDLLTILCRFHWRLRSLRHSLECITGSDTTQTAAEIGRDQPYDGSMVYEVADAPSGLHYSSRRRRGAPGCGRWRGGAVSDPADQAHRPVPFTPPSRHPPPPAPPP